MIFFVAYAMLVWYGALLWRRRAWGFACVGGGFFGLLLVAWFHLKLNEWTEGGIFLPVFQSILYPYIALVVAVGLFIASLPTREQLAERDKLCVRCRYDLSGLDGAQQRCPECGMWLHNSAANQPPDQAGDQDEPGQSGDHQPREP